MQETFQSRLTTLGAVFLMCTAIAGCGGGDEQASVAPPPVVAPAPPPATPPVPPHLPVSAYLVVDDQIQLCRFEENDATCSQEAGEIGFEDMVAMAVAGTSAYIASNSGPTTIIHCSIDASGNLSECVDTENSTAEAARALTVRGTTLYIGGSSTPRVRMCGIQDDGSLRTCSDALFPADMAADVEEIRFAGSRAYLLHNGAGRVSTCTVQDDGTLFDCAYTSVEGLGDPLGLEVAGNHMYIADFGTVLRCVVEPDGSLTGCVDAGVLVNAPSQVAVRGASVYITDLNSNFGVIRCTAGNDGFLTGCRTMYNQSAHSIVLN